MSTVSVEYARMQVVSKTFELCLAETPTVYLPPMEYKGVGFAGVAENAYQLKDCLGVLHEQAASLSMDTRTKMYLWRPHRIRKR